MKFPIFASFIVFIVWLTYELQRHRRTDGNTENAFWEKEALANSTRKKSLEKLSYITIPIDLLPMEVMTEDEVIADIHNTILELTKKTIVNLTGFTNTELKLEYGAANIASLTEYDQNYTMLARALRKWADVLYQAKYIKETKFVLEFAVSTKTDVSACYKLLAEIYFAEGEFEKIQELLTVASELNSAMKNSIVRTLQEFCLYND